MLQVDEVDDKVAFTAFMGGLQSSKFLFSLSKDPPNSMAELFIKAQKHMNAKDAMNSRKGKEVDDKKGDKKRSAPFSKDEKDSKFKRPDRSRRVPRGRDSYTNFTPLNAPIIQILMQLQDDHTLKWPPRLKSDPTKRSKDKYCWLHRDHGHNTDDCFDLKSQIESLIRLEKLHGYTADREKGTGQPIRENRENNPLTHPLGEIRVISGGLAGGGESSSARKAHVKRARSSIGVNKVGISKPQTKFPKREGEVITFSEEDAKGVQQPHDDPLVVTEVVANYTIHRVLIDNGSSADLLFIDAFDKLCIGRGRRDDMPGIDPSVMQHRFNEDPSFKPIR
ncbi:uncharacterized protein LOC132309628 [Cornus florida]|uniref:uncharacterized protein LOC132309628 n=1 Tax=Cornus florida TaxID=4283 RepID=UPI0028982B39|nr:uncharacterized protein LOC132309628 [Cornus florida]